MRWRWVGQWCHLDFRTRIEKRGIYVHETPHLGRKEIYVHQDHKDDNPFDQGITKKYTSTSPCIKLVFRNKIGSITQTTKT